MNIKQLFDPSKDIYRSIEKVIAYGVSQEEHLKKVVSEYVVTDSIDEQFNKLLAECGLTPVSRARMKIGAAEKKTVVSSRTRGAM